MDTLYLLRLKDNPLEPVEGPFIESSSLCDLYIENCNITHLSPQFFTKLEVLEKVDLSGNPLQTIKPAVFDSLIYLDTLSLNNCNLTFIHPEAFKGLVNLQILEIDGNSFVNYVDWPLVLRPLTRLLHFNSVKSNVTNLNNDTFYNNNYMRTLSLAKNDLSNLNFSSFGDNMLGLHYLDISYCNIKGPLAEDAFVNTKKLLILNVSGNRIFNSHLAAAISPLTKLLSLSLRDCGLIMLPKNTFNRMTNLKELDISRNPLDAALTEMFLSPLTSLEILDLGYSEFKTIKNTMFSRISKLKTLILSGNKITDIEKGSFENLKNLEVLELNDCGLNSLMHTIFYDEDEPINLLELKLSGNPLQMPRTGSILSKKLPNLITLDMSKCNLTFVSPDFFASTPNIKQLFLNNNKIRNYEHTLRFMDILYDIELLDLSFNKMKSILPTQLTNNNQLTSLRLYGNPWTCSCNIVDMWDWAASTKISWLDGAMKSNSNETIKLICYYDPTFPLTEQLPTLPGQPNTKTMTWEKFVYHSDCHWKTKSARSISSRVTREVHEEQDEKSKVEKETTVFGIVQGSCFFVLIFILVFVLALLLVMFCITCKVLLIVLYRDVQNGNINLQIEDNEQFL